MEASEIVQAILKLTAQYEALPPDTSAFYKTELTETLRLLNTMLSRHHTW